MRCQFVLAEFEKTLSDRGNLPKKKGVCLEWGQNQEEKSEMRKKLI
jgi:hypothetical protein